MLCQFALGSILALGCSDDGGTQESGGTGESGNDEVDTSEGESESGSTGDTSTTDPTTDTSSTDPTTDTSSTDPTTDTSTTDPTTDTSDTTSETGGLEGADYSQPGPYGVDVSSGQMQANQQCNLAYDVYTPDTLDSDVAVLLAHGFMRSIDDMAATAEHIASWGVKVYAVPLCTNSFQINHQLNGEAIAALGQALEPSGPIYAGFSAGGLAAWVAAANDPAAVAYVGLDAVDNGGLAGMVAGDITAPIRGAIAEPGQCNTNNNFLPVYDMKAGAPVIKIIDAQHFDFETDACGLGDFGCNFCAPAGPETRATTLGMVTAGVLVESGADLGGNAWWQPGGTYFDQLVQDGKIQLVQ